MRQTPAPAAFRQGTHKPAKLTASPAQPGSAAVFRRIAHHLGTLSPPKLAAELLSLPTPYVQRLHDLCCVPDCTCPVVTRPCWCGKPEAECDHPYPVEPCRHAKVTPEIEVSALVEGAIFARLFPGYDEPAPPAQKTKVEHQETRSYVLAERHAARTGLYHPDDYCKCPPRVLEAVARETRKSPNGHGIKKGFHGKLRRDTA